MIFFFIFDDVIKKPRIGKHNKHSDDQCAVLNVSFNLPNEPFRKYVDYAV